ncbi:MAG TPA: hypothetical protein VFN14_03205 [Candidatus Limnocylindria bacterium]|nr:hypothetical protein [Candidatus Limnocylindria bacterium]
MAIDGRLVAVGSTDAGSRDRGEPAAWYSDDGGRMWTPATVEQPRAPAVGFSHVLAAVAEHDGVMLALDAYTVGTASGGDGGAADQLKVRTDVWTSTDHGITWTLAAPVPGSGAHISAGRDGFIVLGTLEGGTLAGWRSKDGSTWDALTLNGIEPDVSIHDLAFNGSSFMALGVHITNDRTGASGGWVSTDGSSWTPIDDAGGVMGTGGAISAAGNDFVVGGSRSESEDPVHITPVVWRSNGVDKWSAQVVKPASIPVAAATDVVSNDFGELVHLVSGARVPASVKSDELWFLPASPAGAREQDVPLPVSAIAAMPDRFVIISRCGPQPPACTPTVSVGTPVRARVASTDASTADSPSPVASASVRTEPTPSPTPTPDAAWIATPIGQAGGITAMVESGPTLTAVGWAQNDIGMPGGEMVWTSGDGSTWSQAGQVTVDGQPTSGVVLASAVWVGSRYVVGGYGGVDQTLPIILTSDDRTHWAVAELPGDLTCGRIDRLMQQGPQLIAVGFDCTSNRALLLASADGAVWTRDEDGFADLGGAELGGIIDVDGDMVAVGSGIGPDSLSSARVWRSSAGKGEAIAALGQGHARDIAALQDRLVVVGDLGDSVVSKPAIWTSSDGVSWTLATLSDRSNGTLTSVISTDRGFVAVGSEQRADGFQAPMLYTSPDGTRWERAQIAGFGRGYLTGAVATRFGPIVFGILEDEAGTSAPVFVTPHR